MTRRLNPTTDFAARAGTSTEAVLPFGQPDIAVARRIVAKAPPQNLTDSISSMARIVAGAVVVGRR